MNVIIANRYQVMLSNLGLEVIKELDGEFEVDEIVSQFQNFYFNRMILDITALKNYKDLKTVQKLSISLDMGKIILLLDDSPEVSSPDFLSKLISIGIYNFTTNPEGIMYLYNNPNTYRDVAQYHQIDAPSAAATPSGVRNGRIIGVKNVTNGAGSSTLIYMMKKHLERVYSVKAIEADKRDLSYFRDPDMISTSSNEIGNAINKVNGCDVILLDINNSIVAEGMCHDVIYLIEPSIIKLNKMMILNGKVLSQIKNKMIVLNKSLLTSRDIPEFEYESKVKVFYNLPPLDDRSPDPEIMNDFLIRLGFDRLKNE